MECSIKDCDKPGTRRSWCTKHYQRWQNHGDPLWEPTVKVCKINLCGRKVAGYGWCQKHYDSWHHHGDPLYVYKPPTAEERFWPKVNKDGPISEYAPHLGQCWIWSGTITKGGYGQFRFNNVTTCSHRASYELLVGPIPEGLHIDHLCRVRKCVNPSHLETVTQKENTLRGEGLTARYARRTHCHKGHEYFGDSFIFTKSGARRCMMCRPIKNKSLQEGISNWV